MEVQKNILSKIRDETGEHLKSEIFPLISQLVETKMKEESEKFLDGTNILGDVFPKLVGSGLFRTCGKCCVCKENSQGDWSGWSDAANSTEFNTDGLNDDEYILLCSGYGINPGRYPVERCYDGGKNLWKPLCEVRGEYLTNYGSIINLYKYHSKGPNISIYHKGENMLTQEFITYYNNYIDYSASNLRTDNYGSKRLTHNDLKNIITTYNQYNPKASENYRIEKQKQEIEKMTLGLQEREIELVTDKQLLYEKQLEYAKEKEKFTEEKKIHKQKSKNLLKRENSVFLKESIRSVHQELKDISYSLSDAIDLLDDVDPIIEQRLNQTIQKLNSMFNGEVIVEAEELEAVEAIEVS